MPALKYTAEELENKINEYFEMKRKKKKEEDRKMIYMSISDICSYLDITSQTWRNYKNRDGYFGIIKRAEEKIKAAWIKNLFYPGRNATGAMFWLKNQAGWADKVEHQHSGEVEHKHRKALQKVPDELLRQMKHQLEGKNDNNDIVDVTPDEDNKEG